MKGLEGKTALVTGGSSGIGQAIAIGLGREGVNVAVNYVGRPEGAEATKDAIDRGVQMCMKEVEAAGARAMLVEADVSKEDEVEAMFEQVGKELGTPDFLVNNAGIQISGDSDELDPPAFDRVLAVNLRGSFLCARQAIRRLLAEERAGAIVNVSSVHQIIPKPKFLSYSVSKGGMQNLTRTLALEYAGRNIRVNGIGPGYFRTALTDVFYRDAKWQEAMLAKIPMGRFGHTDDLVGAAVFLCSDAAAYITGQCLYVDGGYMASI